jgi:TonB family protein
MLYHYSEGLMASQGSHERLAVFAPFSLPLGSSTHPLFPGALPAWCLPSRSRFCRAAVRSPPNSFLGGHPTSAAHHPQNPQKRFFLPCPSILRSKGIGGVVRLKVFVKSDGTVRDAEVLPSNPILAESAQKSVMQWKFSATSSETSLELSVTFDPHGESGNEGVLEETRFREKKGRLQNQPPFS